MKKKSNTYLVVATILILIVGISIGYAALSSTLNISGRTAIKKTTWDVHFATLSVTNGSVEAITPAEINEAKTDVNYSVNLEKPGDYYEFTVDVVNGGTIPAKLAATPTITGLTEAQKQYITYTVTYADGTPIQKDDKLGSEHVKIVKVRVEYKKDLAADQLPTTDQEANLTFAMNFVQE
ncbi:MAG: hypothetical protein IKG58_03030 [Bacilli bacterium]|nr:hypothetical protein [Bacilli bacterium]MBR3049511.1 hypothetical protein [Bacilli bacterium]